MADAPHELLDGYAPETAGRISGPVEWLTKALAAERLRQERSHQALLEDFQRRVAEWNSGGREEGGGAWRLDEPMAAQSRPCLDADREPGSGDEGAPKPGARAALGGEGDVADASEPPEVLAEIQALSSPPEGPGAEGDPSESGPTSRGKPGAVKSKSKIFSKRLRDQARPIQFLLERDIAVPHWYIKFSRGVRGDRAELGFTTLVLLNAIFLCLESQHQGLLRGHESGVYPYGVADKWSRFASAESTIELGFGIAFTIELSLKVAAWHVFWPRQYWNLIDLFVVVLWWIQMLGSQLNVNPLVGRLVRLCKIARLVKIAKSMVAFDSLRLMLASILHCVPIATWSVLLVLMVTMAGALFMTGITQVFIESGDEQEGDQLQMFAYFGTFTRAWLSMVELTTANWVPITRFVLKAYGDGAAFAILGYQLVVGFSMMKVIAGVFLQETYKANADDDELMILRKHRETESFRNKLNSLLQFASSEDGTMRLCDFEDAVERDVQLKEWLGALDLDVSNAHLIWGNERHNSGLTLDELGHGVRRIRGFARASDLLAVQERMEKIVAKDLLKHYKDIGSMMSREMKDMRMKLEAYMNKDFEQLTGLFTK